MIKMHAFMWELISVLAYEMQILIKKNWVLVTLLMIPQGFKLAIKKRLLLVQF